MVSSCWRRMAWALAVIVLVPASMARAEVMPGDDAVAIEMHMRALELDALGGMAEEGIPLIGTEVTVVDLAVGYRYSSQRGLRPLLPAPLGAPGVPRTLDGSTLWPAAEAQSSVEAADSLPPGSTSIVRRVPSCAGNRKVEGTVTLGSTTGIDGAEGHAEGAFNYFGLTDISSYDAEIGMCTQYNSKHQDQGRWYMYHSVVDAVHTDWDRDEDGWPSGGAAPGTSVFMRLWIRASDQIGAYVSIGGVGSYTQYYDVAGARYDCVGQFFRRMTTMVLEGSGSMGTTAWSGVKIYTPDHGGGHLWGTSDTNIDGIHTDSAVSVTNLHPYYAETITISSG